MACGSVSESLMKRFFQKTIKNITDWIEEDEDDAETSKPAKKTAANPESPKRPLDAKARTKDVGETFDRLSKDGAVPIAGKVQLIRFDQIRKTLGDKWPRYEERIEQIVQKAIQKHLTKQDSHWSFGDCAYLMTFNTVSIEEAERKCELIREEVNKFFHGVPALQNKIEITAEVTEVSKNPKLDSSNRLDEIYNKLSKGSAAAAKNPTIKSDPGSAPKESGWKDTQSDKVRKEKEKEWELNSIGQDAVNAALKGMEFAYRPLWRMKDQQLSARIITPIREISKGLAYGTDVLARSAHGDVGFELDIWALERVISDDETFPSEDIIMIPVHHETLVSLRYRNLFVTACNKIPAPLRERLQFEITALPTNPHPSGIQDGARTLMPYAHSICVRYDLRSPNFNELYSAGIRMVGFQMQGWKEAEETTMDLISEFIRAAEQAGLDVYAKSVPEKHLSLTAIGLGVGYIAGNINSRFTLDGQPPAFRQDDLYTNPS